MMVSFSKWFRLAIAAVLVAVVSAGTIKVQTLGGRPQSITTTAKTKMVFDLKSLIAKNMRPSIPSHQQKLVHRGKELGSFQSLASLNLRPTDVIIVMPNQGKQEEKKITASSQEPTPSRILGEYSTGTKWAVDEIDLNDK